MKKILILAAGIAATAAAVTALTVGRPAGGVAPQTAQAEPATTVIDGYELDPSLTAATAFPGNELIFEARVVRTEAPRKVVANGNGPAYIYTPVLMKVERSVRGGLAAGQTVTVRALGGTIANERTVSRLSPDLAEYREGRHLLLMTARSVDAGDGVQAVTPNYLLGFDDQRGTVFNISDPAQSQSAKTFSRALANARGTSIAK
ncbi:hypothetical protein ACFV9C_43480 [Kribbella sp. NPDC059898]|uniref:hypothetical protein n=1 Tax=Kribbella sp. NPDC059898 TaxID=3346995 RepID=UPI003657FD8D